MDMIPTSTNIFFPSSVAASATTNDPVALVLPDFGPRRSVMAFSIRTGGCSPRPFESLNFSVSQGDEAQNVGWNYEALAKRLGIDAGRTTPCRQVHGDSVEFIDSIAEISPQADAIITTTPGIYPAIKTADCLPILLLDPVHRLAAAIHAGWRGTVLRITRKVLRLMKSRFGTDPTDLVAALGPAIGPCCYEVDEVVLKPFRETIPEAEQFIVKSESRDTSRESHRLDLRGANRLELIREGVPTSNIRSADLCTCCNPALFFSYRRDGVKSGRHLAVTGFIP